MTSAAPGPASPYAAALAARLWRADGCDVYAVLDGARDAAIHRAVGASGLEHACLYSGDLAPELQEVAPYIVRLERDAPFLQTLLNAGWGQSWGVFLASPQPLSAVRQHLRRFLRVQDESGRRLLFRYYDPRVLRVYLPTCTPQEITQFFGAIERYIVEDAAPAAALEFVPHAEGVTTHQVDLSIAPAHLPFAGINLRKHLHT